MKNQKCKAVPEKRTVDIFNIHARGVMNLGVQDLAPLEWEGDKF